MISTSIIRYLMFLVLIIHSIAIGRDERPNNMINSKDQPAEKVDVFDMFNDPHKQNSKSTDDTSNRGSTKEKANVQKSKLDHADAKSCPSTGKYQTLVVTYRSIAKSWSDKLLSKDTKVYRLTIDFSANELNRLKRFASSLDHDQDKVLHDIRDISHNLIVNAHVDQGDNPSSTGLTWSAWIRSHSMNSIDQGVLSIAVAVGAISIFFFRSRIHPIRALIALFMAWFLVSVYQNWHALYQEEKAKIEHILMKGPPKGCQSHSWGFIDRITTFIDNFLPLSTDKCLEYERARHASPHSQATLVKALSMTIIQPIVTPLGPIGEGLSLFFRGLKRHVNIFYLPVVLFIIVFLIVVLILVRARYQFSLPFRMFTLEPRNNHQQEIDQLRREITLLQTQNQQLPLQPQNQQLPLQPQNQQLPLQLQ